MANLKALHGPPLIEAGYKLVPIKAGAKHPGAKKWPQIRSTMADVEKWARSSYYGGLGVLGQFTPGIDVDVDDSIMANRLLSYCWEKIGYGPVRYGKGDRFLFPCQPPPGGLGPDCSAKYQDDEQRKVHQIEIKATGQQWVAYGRHPETKEEYRWPNGELYDYDADWLPVLTPEKIEKLFDFFDSHALHDGWTKVSEGRQRSRQGVINPDGAITGAVTFENYVPPINVETDRLRSMLRDLDPDAGHDTWVRVGMALHHQYDGSDEGLGLFIEWSERSKDYDLREIEQRWPTWGAGTYGGKPVTAASIVAMQKKAVKRADDPTRRLKPLALSEWIKRYAMVAGKSETEVYDTGVEVHRAQSWTLRAFREQNTGYRHRFPGPDGAVKDIAMVDAWAAAMETQHYSGYVYQPGDKRFCRRQHSWGDDAMYVNTFFYPPHPEVYDGARLQAFFRLVEHIFPVESERLWIWSWMARMVQQPGVRSFVTPINITTVTGTGRGLLFNVLSRVLGAHNCHDVSRDDLEGRFNGFLGNCILAVIQEIKAATGDRKYTMWEKMKSMLADTTANIQPKGKDSYTATIYANFLMFSNNLDALPIQDVNERRIYAMQGASSPLPLKQVDEIVLWMDDPENIAALFWKLKRMAYDPEQFKRAPVTETKRQMVLLATGHEQSDLSAWLDNGAPEVFDYDFCVRELGDSDSWAEAGMSRKSFGRLMADKGYHSKQLRLDDGRRTYVYYHPDRVKAKSPADLRRALSVAV